MGNDEYPTKYTIHTQIENEGTMSVRVDIRTVRSPSHLRLCSDQIIRVAGDYADLSTCIHQD